jgi:hypothetical protein
MIPLVVLAALLAGCFGKESVVDVEGSGEWHGEAEEWERIAPDSPWVGIVLLGGILALSLAAIVYYALQTSASPVARLPPPPFCSPELAERLVRTKDTVISMCTDRPLKDLPSLLKDIDILIRDARMPEAPALPWRKDRDSLLDHLATSEAVTVAGLSVALETIKYHYSWVDPSIVVGGVLWLLEDGPAFSLSDELDILDVRERASPLPADGAGPLVASAAIDVGELELERVVRLARLADAIYEDSFDLFVARAGLDADQVIVYLQPDWKRWCHPPFALVLDPSLESIVLVIRGTKDVHDLLADIAATATSFLDGTAHHGIAAVADALLARSSSSSVAGKPPLVSLLETVMDEHPTYSVAVTGHSLGAGIATVVAMKLIQRFEARIRRFRERASTPMGKSEPGHHRPRQLVHCWAFCPPPTVSASLAEQFNESITSVLHGDDIVPTLSLSSMYDFQQVLEARRPEWEAYWKNRLQQKWADSISDAQKKLTRVAEVLSDAGAVALEHATAVRQSIEQTPVVREMREQARVIHESLEDLRRQTDKIIADKARELGAPTLSDIAEQLHLKPFFEGKPGDLEQVALLQSFGRAVADSLSRHLPDRLSLPESIQQLISTEMESAQATSQHRHRIRAMLRSRGASDEEIDFGMLRLAMSDGKSDAFPDDESALDTMPCTTDAECEDSKPSTMCGPERFPRFFIPGRCIWLSRPSRPRAAELEEAGFSPDMGWDEVCARCPVAVHVGAATHRVKGIQEIHVTPFVVDDHRMVAVLQTLEQLQAQLAPGGE